MNKKITFVFLQEENILEFMVLIQSCAESEKDKTSSQI
jgi:hypothetical protein